MMRVTLPFRCALQQPLITAASTATNLLSLSMTLAAACRHWPANLPFAVATAVTCELCKLALFCTGLASSRAATSWRERASAVTRLSLASLFALGSVGASMVCMSQAETTEHARTLQESRAYASAIEALHSAEAQMATLRAAADSDIANGYRKRGLASLAQLQTLAAERDAADKRVLTMEQHPILAAGSPTLPQALDLVGIDVSPFAANLVIELLIGLAVELAGFLFLSQARGPAPGIASNVPPSPRKNSAPIPDKQPRVVRTETWAAANSPDGNQAPSCSPIVDAPIPPTYARWLRFDFGPRLRTHLTQLEGERCFGACRDLLQRMGEHCLREGWSDGTIDVSRIRQHLRAGRDWRTIKGYLDRLAAVGALTLAGATYTITHFLAANPSVQRRTQRLAELRNQACERQDKHRKTVQSLQPQHLQEAGLTGLSSLRHAQKPQPTSHAVRAAHAATHPPTRATEPHSCDSDVQPADSSARQRSPRHSVTQASNVSDAEHQLRLERLSAKHSAESDETPQMDGHGEPPQAPAHTGLQRGLCIPAAIPAGGPLANQHLVVEACERIGLPRFGVQAEDLFHRLVAEGVREPEIEYAAFCTKKRRLEGKLRNPMGFFLAVIRKQRLVHSGLGPVEAAF